MSMQSEGEDAKGPDAHQSTRNDAGSADGGGTGDTGAAEESTVGEDGQQLGQQDSQQDAMPPSQTDDDQYDQGTAQREP
jgi:hypothetical protein